jgi:ketosteroid isomerase-like protein
MNGNKALSLLLFAVGTVSLCAQTPNTEEKMVRKLIETRNSAYHRLDADTLTRIVTPDFQLVDRFGDNIASEGPEYTRALWSWTFREVYKNRPGPVHHVVDISFIRPDVALAQTHADWSELKLDDGTTIPPHGEVDTFLLIKTAEGWRIRMQTIHNQFPPRLGDHPDFPQLDASTKSN